MSAEVPARLAREVTARRGQGLLITRNNTAFGDTVRKLNPGLDWDLRDKDALRGWGPRRLLELLRSNSWAMVLIEDNAVDFERRRDLYALLAALAKGGPRWLVSTGPETGVRKVHPAPELMRMIGVLAAEGWSTTSGLFGARRLSQRLAKLPPGRRAPENNRRIAVLKSDFWFGVTAGGSIAHTVGVLDGMNQLGLEPRMWTSASIPGAAQLVPEIVVHPDHRPSFVDEAGMAAYNRKFIDSVIEDVRRFDPAVVYQRHGVFSVVGLAVAQALSVPLVLEVNSSEVWVRRNWSRLQFDGLAEYMERTVFAGAERLILVSEALRPVVESMGGRPSAMTVVPNGVDVSRFFPDSNGEAVRAKLGIPADRVVCGFIGTYHKWHGVLFLAEQAVSLLQESPSLHLMMMGDGDLTGECKSILRKGGVEAQVTFTGMLSPDDVPEHLASCDILLSPHLPFEDGSRFFGSPTKLFEYLAAGRPVVASRLGQIGDVVQDGVNGFLIEPGSGEEFRTTVKGLAEDAVLRKRLGQEARAKAVRDHTWKSNVESALSGIVEIAGP